MTKTTTYGGNADQNFDATGRFRIEHRDGRSWLVDPAGGGFVSIGMNHVDESNLKYLHNREIWKKKYGSRDRWITDGLVADLRTWGFNTIGWTQEYISGDWGAALDWFGDPINLGHSTPWSARDFDVAAMPYVQQLRVAEIEDWNGHPFFPDVYSSEFDVYADYIARSICVDHADSENLIGYFLVDIPSWLPHANGDDFPQLKGLEPAAREQKVYDVARKYYQVVAGHIRKYDPDHLILGDRYNGNKGIPEAVLRAMAPYVDVFSVQYFPGPDDASRNAMRDDLARWHNITGKPVLIADIGNWSPTEMNPGRVSPLETQRARGEDYVAAMASVLREPWLVGWHWCAYVENTARGWGLKDPYDQPYSDAVDLIASFNHRVYDSIADARRPGSSTWSGQ